MKNEQRRRPTYHAALRLARIALELGSRPYGWSFDSIQKELRITRRTVLRYAAACRSGLCDWADRPLIEVTRRGPRRFLRLRSAERSPDSGTYRAASLYFTMTLLQFLEGTVLKESIADLWERSFELLSPSDQRRLTDMDRKFYAVPYTPKIYRDYDELLDLLFRALIDQNTIRVRYAGLSGDGKVQAFDPYTLVNHRGGLYLIGFSHLHREIRYLAVERIRKAEFALDADRNRLRFAYPENYRPETHLDGTFGLIDGPETQVELLLLGSTEAYLRPRMIHPTQKFLHRGGRTILQMRVRGTTELRNFILGLGPWVKVLKPRALRAEIAGLARETVQLYGARAQ